MKTILFTIALKKIKYLEVNLTRMLITSTRRTTKKFFVKEIKKDYRRWRDLHAHGLAEST
jgi:hypothetical protein